MSNRQEQLATGINFLRKSDWSESRKAFMDLLATDGNAADARYGLAVAEFKLGNLEAAADHFAKALEGDPGNANACYYLGKIAARHNDVEGARRFYQKALSLNPKHAGALDEIGQVPAGIDLRIPNGGKDSAGLYDLLRADRSQTSRQVIALIDALRMDVQARPSAFRGRRILLISAGCISTVVAFLLTPHVAPESNFVEFLFFIIVALPPWFGLLALREATKNRRYTFGEGRLKVTTGIVIRHVNVYELYRIVHIELWQGYWNRKTGDGSLLLKFENPGFPLALTGLATIKDLEDILNRLRDVVQLLRTSTFIKGIVR